MRNFSFRTAFAALALLIIGIWFFAEKVKVNPVDFEYILMGCRIYDLDGKIVFNSDRGSICDFTANGERYELDGGLFNAYDSKVFSQTAVVHHDVKFSPDQKSILSIEAEARNFQGKLVKADCAVRRNFSGEVEAKWCLHDHVNELLAQGYSFPASRNLNYLPDMIPTTWEISHANSLYEIPENALSRENEAMRAGNYIFNLNLESNLILFIDHDMKKILKVFPMSQFPFPPVGDTVLGFDIANGKSDPGYQKIIVHDNRVTPDGKILSFATTTLRKQEPYVEQVLKKAGRPLHDAEVRLEVLAGHLRRRSSVIKWNPLNPKSDFEIIWISEETKSIQSSIRGAVTPMINGNYFIFENQEAEPQLFVVAPDRRVVRRFKIPSAGLPIFTARPFYSTEYLRKHGVIK